ncbi:MAG: hypothetical protein KKC29_13810 [Alphaproteobacteria bacterium]|jgi:hypothetical protein|nr:hypothetical protein [Alphaproteobacteria bacterium]MBU2040895.1 hypothetical protein [Alphaproteobacteria bacterium]MBU2125953.1 hypothetical protein [Alphaproteobacteria bacterium]MBU2209135.1 hypothetical protein [Alphaproteobacteria bacterium]MBU2292165.1 hypothetical protein [Alphaproteobacteria bacterium]
MIPFLNTRHPEVAACKFRWLSEAALDVRARVRFGPERVSDDVQHGRLGEAVNGHAGEGVLAQDDRFHNAIVATSAQPSTHGKGV